MKKVVRIFILLSVLAIGGLLICCSGGGSSSDDDDAPDVSTTSTTTTTPTSYLARVMYTTSAGEHLVNNQLAMNGYYLYNNDYAVPAYDQDRIRLREESHDATANPPTVTFSLTADPGYYIVLQDNMYVAVVLPDGIIGSEIDPNTNCWVR